MPLPDNLIAPPPLAPGATLGVATPSWPAYALNNTLFEHAVRNLERAGYGVKLGSLTAARASEGYRSGSPQARADELNALFADPDVDGILTTIGGMNSSSLIPYLDYDLIRRTPKALCGYSDVTAIHMALLRRASLATYYGPGLLPHWGEFPDAVPESVASFQAATARRDRVLEPFARWSRHRRDWSNDDWQTIPRAWVPTSTRRVRTPGVVADAPIVVANLNTLVALAGTDVFPDVSGCVLLLEEMDAPLSREERSLRQLQLMGVFDRLEGLLLGRPERPDAEGAPFDFDALVDEIVGPRPYPVVVDVDVSHTVPMHTIRQGARVSFAAEGHALEQIQVEG